MKSNLFFLFLLLLTFIQVGLTQQLSSTVIASSGGFYTTPSAMLSFTTGEMTAVETYITPTTILTQGFQQNWDFGTAVEEHPSSNFSLEIFPNPSNGNVSLKTTSEVEAEMHVEVLDVVGKEILDVTYFHQGIQHTQTLDLTHAAPGLYLVIVNGKANQSTLLSPVITKIQIIK